MLLRRLEVGRRAAVYLVILRSRHGLPADAQVEVTRLRERQALRCVRRLLHDLLLALRHELRVVGQQQLIYREARPTGGHGDLRPACRGNDRGLDAHPLPLARAGADRPRRLTVDAHLPAIAGRARSHVAHPRPEHVRAGLARREAPGGTPLALTVAVVHEEQVACRASQVLPQRRNERPRLCFHEEPLRRIVIRRSGHGFAGMMVAHQPRTLDRRDDVVVCAGRIRQRVGEALASHRFIVHTRVADAAAFAAIDVIAEQFRGPLRAIPRQSHRGALSLCAQIRGRLGVGDDAPVDVDRPEHRGHERALGAVGAGVGKEVRHVLRVGGIPVSHAVPGAVGVDLQKLAGEWPRQWRATHTRKEPVVLIHPRDVPASRAGNQHLPLPRLVVPKRDAASGVAGLQPAVRRSSAVAVERLRAGPLRPAKVHPVQADRPIQ